MKKVMILFLFVIMLAGCTGENDEAVVVDVCDDDCILNDSEIEEMRLIYREKVASFMKKIAPNYDGNVKILSRGDYYTREDINRIDPVSGNWDIPITFPVNDLDRVQSDLYRLVTTCEVNTTCDFHKMLGMTLKEVEYGYTEYSGYYSFKGYSEEDTLYTIEYGKFNFDGEHGNFEQLVYFPSMNHYTYKTFTDDKYYSYEYSDGEYEYLYIDIDSLEIIYIASSDDGSDIVYSGENQVVYKYFEKYNSFEVIQYEDFEFVSSLSKHDEEYKSTLNFHFVNGWDTLYKENITGPGIYDKLYNEDIEVYSEYNIFTHPLGVRYYAVDSFINMSESELNTFTYPETYIGEHSFTELKEEFDYLTSLNDPYELLNFTEEDLIAQFEDYLEQFTDEFNIEND